MLAVARFPPASRTEINSGSVDKPATVDIDDAAGDIGVAQEGHDLGRDMLRLTNQSGRQMGRSALVHRLPDITGHGGIKRELRAPSTLRRMT